MAAAAAAASARTPASSTDSKALPYLGFMIIQSIGEVASFCSLGCLAPGEMGPCRHHRTMTHGQRVTVPFRCPSGHTTKITGTVVVESAERILDMSIDKLLITCFANEVCPACRDHIESDGPLIYGPSATTSVDRLMKMSRLVAEIGIPSVNPANKKRKLVRSPSPSPSPPPQRPAAAAAAV